MSGVFYMKASILSDLHLDFWLKPGKTKIAGGIKNALDECLDSSEDVEVLIVAGDLTHYPSQLPLLDKIAELYNYKKVFAVLGNHDMYLVSGAQRNRYKTSQEKVKDYYKYNSDVVSILDGEIQEYKGITFGGAMSWYDGEYRSGFQGMYSMNNPIQEWKNTMNDSRLIKGYEDFYDIFLQEKPKIETILWADVIITHVCPLAEAMALQEQYRLESSSKFYTFDGEEYLDQTDAKFWIHGHQHFSRRGLNIYDTELVVNTLGYPNEPHKIQKMTIEI